VPSRDNGAIVVSGAIIGTLVGGSSTIGTVQLAYSYGFSAWWFTLGAGISCLLLAVLYVKPLRSSCKTTLTSMVAEHYGQAAGLAATVFSSVGMYINILAQLISAASIVMILLPDASLFEGLLTASILMLFYALSGGVKGIGKIGVFKTVLLYFTIIGGSMLAIHLSGGLFSLLKEPVLQDGYLGLFNRGIEKDLGNGVSVILGVISTQSYAQAILAGRSDASARKGALISAFMIPPIGIGGVLIGMYMRVHYPTLTATKFALPMFIQLNMPPVVAGVIYATLLLTILGTGAGLTMGISTTIRQDLIQNEIWKLPNFIKGRLTDNMLTVFILLSAVIIASKELGNLILDFSFMSMGLRAASIFIPIQFALFAKDKVARKYVLAAVISGPLIVFAGHFVQQALDPLFLGIFSSMLITSIGWVKNRK